MKIKKSVISLVTLLAFLFIVVPVDFSYAALPGLEDEEDGPGIYVPEFFNRNTAVGGRPRPEPPVFEPPRPEPPVFEPPRPEPPVFEPPRPEPPTPPGEGDDPGSGDGDPVVNGAGASITSNEDRTRLAMSLLSQGKGGQMRSGIKSIIETSTLFSDDDEEDIL